MQITILSTPCAWVLSGALASQAAVLMTTEQRELAGDSKPQSTEIILEKDKLRIDMHDEKDMTLIYRQDKDVFWNIDRMAKTYTEMTSEDLQEIGEAMDEARKKMAEKMRDLPPEQKAMMEKMMGNLLPGASKPKVTFQKEKGSGKVSQWSCENWGSYIDGVKKADHCVAGFKSVGVAEEDFAVFKDMAKFLGKLGPAYQGMLEQGMSLGDMGGVPVLTTTFDDEGKAESRITLLSVKRQDVGTEKFDLPSGYKKNATPKIRATR